MDNYKSNEILIIRLEKKYKQIKSNQIKKKVRVEEKKINTS